MGRVATTAWANYCGPVLPNPPMQSTFPVGGNRSTRRKPTTFGRALTILFSHENWVRIHIKMTLLEIELGTLEVKGEWSDHYTTEAPTIIIFLVWTRAFISSNELQYLHCSLNIWRIVSCPMLIRHTGKHFMLGLSPAFHFGDVVRNWTRTKRPRD